MILSTLGFRILHYLDCRIRNGEFSERSLARHLGVSQPHIHNVIKGVRALTPHLADHVILKFELTLDDLFTEEDFRRFAPRQLAGSRSPHTPPARDAQPPPN